MIRIPLSILLLFPTILVGSFTFPSVLTHSGLQYGKRSTTDVERANNWKLYGTREDEIRRKVSCYKHSNLLTRFINSNVYLKKHVTDSFVDYAIEEAGKDQQDYTGRCK